MIARIILLLLLSSGVASAYSTPYAIQSVTRSHVLANNATYYVDSTGLTLNEVLQQPFVESVDPRVYANPKAVFWIRIDLRNETSFDQFILTIDQWNGADLFISDGDRWQRTHSGTFTPVRARPVSLHRLISFPIVIGEGEDRLILIRTQIAQPLMRYYANQFSFLAKIQLEELGYAQSMYIGNQLLVVFILGIVTILFAYNLSLFFVDRQLTTLILSVYFILIALVIANIHGITTNYLLPQFQAYEMYMALHLAHITPIVIGVFILTFFKLNRKDWEAWLVSAFMVFMCFSWFFSFQTNQSLFYFERRYLEYAIFLTVIVVSVVKKKNGAGIILAAILATILTSHFAEFKAVFFEGTTFVRADFPYLIGVLVQVLIFSAASTQRIRNLKRGVTQLREAHRHFVENQNEELKVQVAEKTEALQEALSSLQLQKNELELVNKELLHNSKQLEQQSVSIQRLNMHLEELVKQRTLALELALRDLDIFFYRVSHDLRRPLTSILGLNNLIEKESDVGKMRSLAAMVNKTVLDVDRMLKKLIAISLCHQNDIEMVELETEEVIAEAIREVKRQYADYNFSITTQIENVKLINNFFLLRTIIECGLENSIVFGGSGVEIKVKAEEREGQLLLTITDNGVGIDPLFIQKAFYMFVRGDDKSAGNGLGLYLARLGAEKLNGFASLKSKPHISTELGLTLPVIGKARALDGAYASFKK